jgi:ISXO2-like transposase domain
MSFCLAREGSACASRVRFYRISPSPETPLARIVPDTIAGTVEADDLYCIAGHKGQTKQGVPKPLGRRPRSRRKKCEPGRGHYDKDRPAILAWVSRQGAVIIHATRDFTVQTVQKAANVAVQAGSRLSTDSARSYQALKGYWHEFVNHITGCEFCWAV